MQRRLKLIAQGKRRFRLQDLQDLVPGAKKRQIRPLEKFPLETWPLALTIRKHDADLEKAFHFFGIRSNDPFDWRYFAGLFAYVLFAESKVGRPGEWDQHRYCELIYAVHTRKIRKEPRCTSSGFITTAPL